jgi:hypothetical protein
MLNREIIERRAFVSSAKPHDRTLQQRASGRLKRLIEIGDEIGGILDADG